MNKIKALTCWHVRIIRELSVLLSDPNIYLGIFAHPVCNVVFRFT